MDLVMTLLTGGLIGWLASLLMKTDGQMGVLANILVGIVGDVSLDALKALQEEGELRVTLSLEGAEVVDGGARDGGTAPGGGRRRPRHARDRRSVGARSGARDRSSSAGSPGRPRQARARGGPRSPKRSG